MARDVDLEELLAQAFAPERDRTAARAHAGRRDDGDTVAELSLRVAAGLGLDEERMRSLELAALLHDVGEIAVPQSILEKPGRLEPHEWMLIETHTLEGERMLAELGGCMREVGAIVRSHHERWDGAGYPDGLAGEEIPLEARIIACCDAWHAMRTDRAYRVALSYEVAVTELRWGAGSQFDPRVALTLLAVVEAEAVPASRRHVRPTGGSR